MESPYFLFFRGSPGTGDSELGKASFLDVPLEVRIKG